ncbi:DUF3564 family protein [Paraburkholderia sp. CNPSo 3155]|uniref:DUF3564 family protein n=1 Tax=Paraburkholderia atlantica TaxID=2654982 RepID=UPI00039E0B0C|nr:DUF3564 family protein [Paraburkholderia atlantica]MPW08436.1 DUF3564 family protein [Paraburkholderia atlantica]NUY35316.1 DUF3564 family protein [Paraburkholderia atlantica]
MRLTVHLDTFDRIHPMAFAILWLDRVTRQWSREGHFGLELPESGSLQIDCGNTLVCARHSMVPMCVLEGLDLNDANDPVEGKVGRLQWCTEGARYPMTGHWRVTCIDTERTQSPNGVFPSEDNA